MIREEGNAIFVMRSVLLEDGEATLVDVSESVNGSMSRSLNDSVAKKLRGDG